MGKAYNPLKFEKFVKSLHKAIFILFILLAIPTAFFTILMVINLFSPSTLFFNHYVKPYLMSSYIPTKLISYNVRLYIFLSYFTEILYYILFEFILWLFLLVINNTKNKKPFANKSISYINTIAWIIIGYTVLMPFYHLFMYPNKNFIIYYLLGSNWGLPLSGLVLIILAKMFQRGAYLQNEYEQTL